MVDLGSTNQTLVPHEEFINDYRADNFIYDYIGHK